MNKYIHEPRANFDFTRVSLKTPFKCGSGGAFLSKFSIDEQPFYIKTPKCTTKQGFVKSGRRTYCDLVFSAADNQDFIHWMLELVDHSIGILSQKSAEWFQDPMTQTEIEDATIPPIKPQKTIHIVRCYAAAEDDIGAATDPQIKAYDENAREIPLAEIHESMDVIALLELRGIKCSLKSFQFEINIKQIMAVKKINIMDSCLLVGGGDDVDTTVPSEIDAATEPGLENQNQIENNLEVAAPEPASAVSEPATYAHEPAAADPEPANLETPIEGDDNSISEENTPSIAEPIQDAGMEEINLEDFSSNVEQSPSIVLKNPNELYYNMYFDAKKRAKDARMKAITAYLEAKNIKMLYDLDDVDDSEDEEDFMDFMDDEGDDSSSMGDSDVQQST